MDTTSPASIDPPANVLLVHTGCDDSGSCHQLRSLDEGTAELRVSFSANSSPTLAQTDDDAPSKLGLISVGDVLRSASADTGPDFSSPIAVDAIADPTDLTAIGTSVSRFCERWNSNGERITLCFQSLDALLRNSPPEVVFQFTHVLTKRLSSVDAYAHFHLDPTAIDDRIVATFGSIFDAVACDDSVRASLPEATDDDVAAVLDDWGRTTDEFATPDRLSSEATDEDIAQLFTQ